MGALRALVSIFTVIPVDASQEDVESLSRHFWLTPLVGALYGVLAGVAFFALALVFSTLVAAVIVFILISLLNRFFHLDGLIDLGDGMVAAGSREKKVAAMKDVSVGAGGVGYALAFTLLTLSALASVHTLFFLIPFTMEVMAKHALVTSAAIGTSKEGIASMFVKNTKRSHFILSAVLSAALVLAVGFLSNELLPQQLIVFAAATLITSSIVSFVVSRVAIRNFGGGSGDILGATNEIARPLVILTALVVMI